MTLIKRGINIGSIIFFVIIASAIYFRFYSLGNSNLVFDEGATWGTFVNRSIYELITGKYSAEGNVPGFYILLKLIPNTNNEWALRSIPATLGLLSIITSYYIYTYSKNSSLTLMATAILAISPAHIYYSREFRNYVPGFFFQTLCLLLFLKLVRKKQNSKFLTSIWLISAFISLSFSFSSIYLLIFFFCSLIFTKSEISNRTRKILCALVILLLTAFSIWVGKYYFSASGQDAFSKYVSRSNRNITGSSIDTIKDLVLFCPYWIDANHNCRNFNTRKANFLTILIFSFVIIFPNLKKLTMPKSQVLLFQQMQMLLFSIFLPSLIFSLLFFDVMSIKLLLLITVPISYIFMVTLTDLFRVFKNSKTYIVLGLPLLWGIYTGQKIIDIKPLDFKSGLLEISKEVFQSSCTYILISQKEAQNLLQIYGRGLPMLQNSSIITINYNNSVETYLQLKELRQKIKHSTCNQLLYLQYYNFWATASGESFVEFKQILNNFSLKKTVLKANDASTLSFTLYQK